MKKLPIGKQVFRRLIEDNFIYIDKTPFLLKLIESDFPTFLSRPRRFGKSLTVNTFKELFLGSKELFKGTYAYYNWDFNKTSPVIKLDMSFTSSDTIEMINKKITILVCDIAEEHNIKIVEKESCEIAFRELIRKLAIKGRVVILIDEYDAPLLNAIDKKILPEVKEILRNFYSVLKEQEDNIRYLFITGISKFGKVGVFSALNNLTDITLNKKYSEICGYTQEDIKKYFSDNIEIVRNELNITGKEFWDKLKHYYNGYSWDGEKFLFNPFSVLSFFENGVFAPYWMETGSPSFIVSYIRNNNINMDELEQILVSREFLSDNDIDSATPESFLMQAGYLTVKEVRKSGSLILDFPNYEVKQSLNRHLLKNNYTVRDRDILDITDTIHTALTENNTVGFLEQLKIIFSSITHHHYDANKNEYFYSALLLMFLQAAGFDVVSEKTTNQGRLDLLLKWKDERIYIIELKLDSAERALEQLIEKNYAGQYKNRECILIGLAINYEKRNITNWKVKIV